MFALQAEHGRMGAVFRNIPNIKLARLWMSTCGVQAALCRKVYKGKPIEKWTIDYRPETCFGARMHDGCLRFPTSAAGTPCSVCQNADCIERTAALESPRTTQTELIRGVSATPCAVHRPARTRQPPYLLPAADERPWQTWEANSANPAFPNGLEKCMSCR